MDNIGKIESILFVASKPLSVQTIARVVGAKEEDVRDAIDELRVKYNHDHSGIQLLSIDDDVQMATHPDNTSVIDGFVKNEIAGELTKAQLETLTVIAYRGPITRPELEVIRGVNCALILRNLAMRGLVAEAEDETKLMPVYSLSFEALRHLGITNVTELPDYETLHAHEHVRQVLNADEAEKAE